MISYKPLPIKLQMKNTSNLKNIYTEQLAKLQQKHQQECDLLEDLR